MTPSLEWPFQQIVVDIFHVSHDVYLACIDRLTGWLSLYHLRPGHTTTFKLMSICWQLFQAYGTPDELSTDGSPPFTSCIFQEFLKTWCVKHYPLSHITNPMASRACGKKYKEDSKWKYRPLRFLGQWQCCPGHLAILKHPNPRYWPITSATLIPPPTPWFHSFKANPLQATPWMGSGSTMPHGDSPPLQCKNGRKV